MPLTFLKTPVKTANISLLILNHVVFDLFYFFLRCRLHGLVLRCKRIAMHLAWDSNCILAVQGLLRREESKWCFPFSWSFANADKFYIKKSDCIWMITDPQALIVLEWKIYLNCKTCFNVTHQPKDCEAVINVL